MTDMNRKSSLTNLKAVLLAGGMTAAAIAVVPFQPTLSGITRAFADPVEIQAPQAPNFADVVEAVSPAVVSVRIESELHPASDRGFRFDRRFFGDDDDLPPFFRNHPFFRDGPRGDRDGRRYGERDDRRKGDRDERRPRRFGMSQGSGFFVSEDGYIVTNHHVVANGSKFTIVMNDGTEYEAKLVGADARTDLAVLKVDENREFTYVKFDEDDIRVGEWVVAVGNPFGLGGTVTAGIVSAHNRAIRSNRYDDFIQIDAAVNKGNSGGPAFNLSGEVIGINTAIFSPSGGNVGIAFAIPALSAKAVVEDLIENGTVVRGWLGVRIQPVTDDIAESVGLDEAGGAVASPLDGSPADEAGIRPGDVITKVDGEKVDSPRELARRIAAYAPESEVTISVWRNGAERDITVTLGKMDNEEVAAATPQSEEPEADDTRSLASLGLELGAAEDGNGVVVADVEPGSSADDKGLRAGDVITSVNGEEVANPDDVVKVVGEADKLGRKAALFQVQRGDDDPRFVAVPFKRG